MKATTFGRFAALLSAASLALVACGGDADAEGESGGEEDLFGEEQTEDGDGGEEAEAGEPGQVVIDGSSTVAPLGEAAAELFMGENQDLRVTVGTSGTGGGFEMFCRGDTDISEASRGISDEEVAACEENDIEYVEIGVANDALSVIVNENNDWLECINIDDLSAIWNQDSDIDMWSDLDSSYPDEPVELYGPGTDSGTFDFFTEEVNGESGNIRNDYNDIGEDDFAAITGAAGSAGAMSFVPLSYVIESEGQPIRSVEIENEAGDCVEASSDTVQDGSYNPLGRQLFMYPSDLALEREEVQDFMRFVLENNDDIAGAANMIPLTPEQAEEAQAEVDSISS